MMFFASLKMMLLVSLAMMRCLPLCARRHTSLGEAVIIGKANIICRGQTSCKKRTFVGRQKCVFYGGEREIRTLGTVLAFTRFPVVRLRPAQPSLHIDLTIISQERIKIKSFLKKSLKISQIFLFICESISFSVISGCARPALIAITRPIIERIAKLLPPV